MFEDKETSIYSIHQLAQTGVGEGKEVGQWFGPNTVAQVLKKLSNSDVWSSLKIHVALDNAVVSDEIVNLCQNGSHDTGSDWNPLLLIIPLRLGLSSINPIYISGLKVVPFNASFQVMVSFTFQLELNSRRAFKCLSP